MTEVLVSIDYGEFVEGTITITHHVELSTWDVNVHQCMPDLVGKDVRVMARDGHGLRTGRAVVHSACTMPPSTILTGYGRLHTV